MTAPDEGVPGADSHRVGPATILIPGAVLRCWNPADARRLDNALRLSQAELVAWTPWVLEGVGDLVALTERLQGYKDEFREGKNLLYAIVDPTESEVLGGAGLYRRIGAGALEIGYWIRSDQTGKGLATEATRALASVGFGFEEVQRIEIHCQPSNRASIRIPQKLGFQLGDMTPGTADRPGETQVWELHRGDSLGKCGGPRLS
ncbi:MAG: GNAT family N-acetyltransferase [Longimicrobiales bacterium]